MNKDNFITDEKVSAEDFLVYDPRTNTHYKSNNPILILFTTLEHLALQNGMIPSEEFWRATINLADYMEEDLPEP